MQISKFDIIIKKNKNEKTKLSIINYTVLCISDFNFSINAQTADEIIENYIENTGGADNWAKC